MKTSEDVHDLGLYASECCGEELVFDSGDTFSRCPRCLHLCEWELVEPLVTAARFEGSEREAA